MHEPARSSGMRRTWLSIVCAAVCAAGVVRGQADQANWPQWRGPALNGVAPGDAPLEWSDSRNVSWKIEIPGRGYSSPIVWGDKLFLTTAVPTGTGSGSADAGGGRGAGGNAGVGEH